MQPLLPPEIWTLILVDHCDSATVDAVSQVNTIFQQLVTENRALNNRRYIQYLPDGLIASPLDPELLERAGGYQSLLEDLYHQQQLSSDLVLQEPALRRLCSLQSELLQHQHTLDSQGDDLIYSIGGSIVLIGSAFMCWWQMNDFASWATRKLETGEQFLAGFGRIVSWGYAFGSIFSAAMSTSTIRMIIVTLKESRSAQTNIRSIESEQNRSRFQPASALLGENFDPTITGIPTIWLIEGAARRRMVELDPIVKLYQLQGSTDQRVNWALWRREPAACITLPDWVYWGFVYDSPHYSYTQDRFIPWGDHLWQLREEFSSTYLTLDNQTIRNQATNCGVDEDKFQRVLERSREPFESYKNKLEEEFRLANEGAYVEFSPLPPWGENCDNYWNWASSLDDDN